MELERHYYHIGTPILLLRQSLHFELRPSLSPLLYFDYFHTYQLIDLYLNITDFIQPILLCSKQISKSFWSETF